MVRAGGTGLALGVRQTAIPIGGAIGALALPVVEQSRGLDAAFLFLAALAVAAALVALVVVREPPARDEELAGDAVPWTLRDSRLWTLCTGSGLYLTAQVALMSFLVLFLVDEHGLSAGEAGAALAALQVGRC